jgi:hypothetical protein
VPDMPIRGGHVVVVVVAAAAAAVAVAVNQRLGTGGARWSDPICRGSVIGSNNHAFTPHVAFSANIAVGE